ncbi:Protein MMS22-like [Talaromyces islandicus]|uniref:Protein MMS22-like n=1 Tax=Talaromyces islandicus TaxID=28573 RepID=A0A0U1M603_TALIS|nr:Protein MMS22-like [Talaromyces islandicus]
MAEVVSGLLVGQRFESLEDFKSAIRNISVRQHWDLRVVRSNKKSVVLGCRSSPNCYFRVVCRANKNATHITSLQDHHSCRRNLGTTGSTPARSEASHVRFLLNEIPKLFDMKSKIKGQDVVDAVKRYHSYDISMRQAQRALTKLQPRQSSRGHGQTANREGSASQLHSTSTGQPGSNEASFDPLAEDRGWAENGLPSTLMDDDSMDQDNDSPTGSPSAAIHVHAQQQQHSSHLAGVAPHVQSGGPSEPSPLPTVQHHPSQISSLPPPPPTYPQPPQQIQLPPPTQANPKPPNQPQPPPHPPQQQNPPPPQPQPPQQQHQQPTPTGHPAAAPLVLTNFKIEFTCNACGALNQSFFPTQGNVTHTAYLPPHGIHPAATNARPQMDGVPNDTSANTAAAGFGAPEYEGNGPHARNIPPWCDLIDSICSRCKAAGLKCTFDLPVQRRGPKTRYPAKNAAAAAANPITSGTTGTFSVEKPPASQEVCGPVTTSTIALPETVWGIGILSPEPGNLQGSLVLDEALAQPSPAFQQWNELETQIRDSVPDLSLEGLIIRCFDLYFEYLFPLIPLIHESGLREILNSFLTRGISLLRHDGESIAGPSMTANSIGPSSIYDDLGLWPESAFALITALCAETAVLLPTEVFAEGCLVSDALLKASRRCLDSYMEADLESPNATSVIVRYCHYNCFQEAGRSSYARRIFAEATCLAQAMQMNDESSYQSLHPLEVELRRRIFWLIFIEDKSAAILRNLPIIIHTLSFETGITTLRPIGDITDIALSISSVMDSSQADFAAGFNATIKLWQAASDILLEIRMLQEHSRITQSALSPLASENSATLDILYIRFVTCLDNVPRHLQIDELDEHDPDYQQPNKMATIQRVNLHVTFQFLRMVLLQRMSALETDSQSKSDSRMLILRKTEVARNMLRVLHSTPFWALQMNRLSLGEKIHFVGADLLAVLRGDENGTSPSITRARSDFASLLDILTRLDFRTPETLQ